MIRILNHHDPALAHQIYRLQQAAYTVERDLIDYPDFPPLHVTAQDIQQEAADFLGAWVDGAWVDGALVGVLSFATTATCLDIERLIVHPQAFRRGIASALLHAVEGYARAAGQLTVSTAAKNLPAVSLYQKHGYQLTQRTTLADGLELVHFFKAVAPGTHPLRTTSE